MHDDDPQAGQDGQVASEAVAAQPASLQLSTGSNGEIISCQIGLNNPQYMEILQNEIKQILIIILVAVR